MHRHRHARATHDAPPRRPPLGQRRQARAAPQIERGEGGEVAEPEGERASVAQREGTGGAGDRGDDDNADGRSVCLRIYVTSYMLHMLHMSHVAS